MKKMVMLLSLVFILTGCRQEAKFETKIIIDDKYELFVNEEKNCTNTLKEYYKYGNQKLFLVCFNEIYLKSDKSEMTLKKYIKKSSNTLEASIDKIIKQLEPSGALLDGGSVEYKNDSITIIKCNTLDNNNDIYIGDNTLEMTNEYCKNSN